MSCAYLALLNPQTSHSTNKVSRQGLNLCFLLQAAASFSLSFQANSAGGYGGAIATTCWTLAKCKSAMTLGLGLPISHGGANLLSFEANMAGGYGSDIATAPSELVLGELAPVLGERLYVPGSTLLNVTFSMLDSMRQILRGSTENPISHMVQLLVLPRDTACDTFESCEQIKLQAKFPHECSLYAVPETEMLWH